MAEKDKYRATPEDATSKLYRIKDSDGNTLGYRRYSGSVDKETGKAYGGSLFTNAYNNDAVGVTNKVYASNNKNEETWLPVEDAKATIGTTYNKDGTASITVFGPEWYAKEVQKSDWFKQNFSENSSYRALVEASLNNPNGSYVDPNDDSKTITYKEALQKYSDAFDQYAEAYKDIAHLKDTISGGFKSNISDGQAIIAGTVYNKDDYDHNGAVYIPKWLQEKHDFTQYKSWDATQQSISAEDFFTKYYSSANFDANGIRKAKELSRERLKSFAAYGAMVAEDEDGKKILNSEDYKEELVRTIAMAKMMSSNEAESDAIMGFSMFIGGVATEAFSCMTHAVSNVGDFMVEISKMPKILMKDLFTSWGMDENGAMLLSTGMTPVSTTIYTAFSALGEFFGACWETDTSGDRLKDWADGMSSDLLAIAKRTGDNAWTRMRDEFDRGMSVVWQGMRDIDNAVEAGKFVGGVLYKIVENIVLLNPLGKTIGGALFGTKAATSAALSAGEAAASTATAVGGAVSKQGVSTMLGVLAKAGNLSAASDFIRFAEFGTNVFVQGVAETLLDDEQVVHDLITKGDSDIAEIVWKNVKFNALGEIAGWGSSKLGETAVAKGIKGTATKVTNRLGYWKNTGLAKLMKTVSGENASPAMKNRIEQLTNIAAREKEIAGTKIFEGFTSEGSTAITKNFAAQQELVLKRIKLENAYDMMNGSIKNSIKGVESKLDPETVETYYKQATDMIKTDMELIDAGVLTKSELEGATLSKEASNYISMKSEYDYLVTKKGMGAELTAKETAKLEAIEPKFKALTDALPADYVIRLNSLYDAIGKYTSQLQMYKIANGLYTSDEQVEAAQRMLDSGWWGENGSHYVHTQRYFADENYSDKFFKRLENFGQRGSQLAETYGKDIDADFVDPLLLSFADVYRTASIGVQRNWQEALLNGTGVVKNVEATAHDVEIAKKYTKLKKDLAKEFFSKENSMVDKTIREIFDNNEFFAKQFNRSKAFKEAQAKVQKKIGEATKENNAILGLGKKSVVSVTASDLSADDIASINSQLPAKMQIPEYDLSGVSAAGFKDWYDALPETSQKQIQKMLDAAGKKLNITNVKSLMKNDPDFSTMLQRNYLVSNKELLKQKPVADLLLAKRTAELDAQQATILQKNIKKIDRAKAKLKKMGDSATEENSGAAGKEFAKNITRTTNDVIGSMEEAVAKNGAAEEIVKMMKEAGVDEGTALRYVTLKHMSQLSVSDIKKSLLRNRFADKELIDATKNVRKGHYKISAESVDNYAQNAADAIHKTIESEYNKILRAFAKGKHGDLLEPGEIFDKVKGYMKDIAAIPSKHDVVAFPNVELGKVQYVQVDPLVADLYNLRPGAFTTNLSDYGTGMQHIIKFFNRTNRIFQWGTTGFSLTSFTNQWFRDSLGAVIGGGARPFLDFGVGVEAAGNIFGKKVSGMITNEYISAHGRQIAESLQKEFGEERWAAFVKSAQDSGMTVEEASVRYAVEDTGYKILPGQEQLTTVGYYSGGESEYRFMRETDETRKRLAEATNSYKTSLYAPGGVEKSRALIDKAIDKATSLQMGGMREVLYRQGVYTSSLGRALDAGMALTDAKEYATRFALDATIDFARPMWIGDALAKSVPYFGAAINGFESFFRLLEIDPAGIAGRFIGGIIMPGMSAIAKTLDNESDRKIYENIPEYEKEDNLIFVQNGTVIRIPLPQEMSVYFAPFRHLVEKAHDANDYSWLALASSDILQISPVDLSGFVDLDANELLGDPSFGDRIARGVEKAASSLMPAAPKAVYKWITGRDPFTGQTIDKSSYYYDSEGNKQVMDTTQSAFAEWLGDVFGDSLSASAAYSIFKDLLGRSGMAIGDTIVTAITKGVDQGIVKAANTAASGVMGVVNPDVYNQGRSDWTRAVRQLEKEKAALLSDKNLQSVLQSIAFEDDPEKLKKYRAERNEYVENYQRKVCNMVETLKKKYPGMYTKTRQGAVMALLNMNYQPFGADNEYARNMSKEIYFQGKQDAISSMQQFGFTSTEDRSILGYGHYNMDGDYEFKWNQPLVIMNMGNVIFGQNDLNTANIQNILDVNDITRKKMYGSEWNSLTTKSQKKEYKKKWNKKVITILAPYITQHGVENLVNSYQVRDLLQDYLFIDNPYQAKEYLYSIFTGGDL